MKKKIEIERGIFIPAAVILLGVILFGFLFTDLFNSTMTFLFNLVTDGTGWLMMIGSITMVVACLVACFTPLAKKKVGGPDAKVEHPIFSWCAMAICSGIATAVVFYAVGEPITYFHNPPTWWNLEAETAETVVRSISQAQYHWGFMYYGIFTFWGLISGYMIYNHGLPPRPSSAFYPILKEKTFGTPGKVIDVLCLLALIGGMVTSLGFGVQQFASGLNYVFGIEPSNLIYIATLAVVTFAYTLSSSRGVKKGMAFISDANAWIYIFLIVFLFICGDTFFEFKLLTSSLGSQITNFISNTFALDPTNEGEGWFQNNTVFYMAWITAYAPLIGCFLAKISKGHTWRAYILVNIFVPAAFVTIWFTAFGGNAIYQDLFNNGNVGAEVAEKGVPIANFALLNLMPLKSITIPIVIAALFFSFITLADAMTGTIAAITVKKIDADEAPVKIKLFWGVLCGATTFLCLFVLGDAGTTSLQNMSIVYALPIFILAFISLPILKKMCNGTVDKEMQSLTAEQRAAISAHNLPETDEAAAPAEKEKTEA